MSLILSFANLLVAALIAGALFGVTLFLNPAGLDSSGYVAVQQQAIRTLNHTLPLLGGVTILVTIAAAIFERRDPVQFALLIAAAVCFVAAGLITRMVNQPINAEVMTWRAGAAGTNWAELRDTWWRWHLTRTASGMAGLVLVITSTLSRG